MTAKLAAVAESGIVCAGLYLYQRFIGLTRGSVPLVAQSIDSRNHVLVTGGVTFGLLAAVIRTEGGGEPDLSAYGFTRHERARERSLCRWIVYQVSKGSIMDEEELEREARRTLDFSGSPSLVALGIAEPHDAERIVDAALPAIREDCLAAGEPRASW